MLRLRILVILYTMCKVESVFSQAKILAFQNCRTDADCFKNSYCYADREERKKCRCKENFILTPINKTVYECLPVAGFGDACDIDVQCQVQLGSLATCDETDNVCKCINDAHLGNDKMCHQSVALGGLCKTNNNCLLSDGSYGVCYVGKCTCNTYQHPSESGNTCVESAILNGECESKENCLQAFSNCYGGICRCIPGYVESEHNIKCLLAASTVGENCTQNIQCSEYIKGSFCSNNTCTCKSAYHGYGNECVPDAKLGERCIESNECIITAELEHSVYCKDERCTCVEGVSDENSYGCIIRSGSRHILPSIFCSIIAYLIVFV